MVVCYPGQVFSLAPFTRCARQGEGGGGSSVALSGFFFAFASIVFYPFIYLFY